MAYKHIEARNLLKKLKRSIPLYRMKVRLIFVNSLIRMDDEGQALGMAVLNKRSATIKIYAKQSQYALKSLVCHEYGHVIAHARGWDRKERYHNAAWGRCYAEVYRAMMNE